MKGLEAFARELGGVSIAYTEEEIVLKSGIRSHWYIDLRRGHSSGAHINRMGDYMLQLTQGCMFDVVAGEGVDGKRILTVDGTWTSGGSMKTLIDLAREAGGIVEDAAVVVDRSGGNSTAVAADMGVGLQRLFEFDEEHHILVPAVEGWVFSTQA